MQPLSHGEAQGPSPLSPGAYGCEVHTVSTHVALCFLSVIPFVFVSNCTFTRYPGTTDVFRQHDHAELALSPTGNSPIYYLSVTAAIIQRWSLHYSGHVENTDILGGVYHERIMDHEVSIGESVSINRH